MIFELLLIGVALVLGYGWWRERRLRRVDGRAVEDLYGAAEFWRDQHRREKAQNRAAADTVTADPLEERP